MLAFGSALDDKYQPHRRELLERLLSAADIAGNQYRAEYIGELVQWVEAGNAYLFGQQDKINEAETVGEVYGVPFDLSDWLNSDPAVSIRDAYAIG